MARTTAELVRGVIETDNELSLTPFIKTANVLVNWLASKDLAADHVLDAATLTEIETYLTAHFYAHRDQQYQSKSTGGSSASFQGQTAMVLMSTQYGQTACLLDSTGLLAKRSADIAAGKVVNRANTTWLGNSTDSPRPSWGEW